MDCFVTNRSLALAHMEIQSRAEAVPVNSDRDVLSMKKAKVHTYTCFRSVPALLDVSDKKPSYASESSSEEESEDDFFEKRGRGHEKSENATEAPESNEPIETREEDDSPLRRLIRLERQRNDDDDDKSRRRHIQEPEVLDADEVSEHLRKRIKFDSSASLDEKLSDEEIERRKAASKQRVPFREEELVKEDDEEDKSGDSSEEETDPRLKPVFNRGRDTTAMKKEKEAQKAKSAEIEAKKLVEEQKRHTLGEESIRKGTRDRSSMHEKEGNVNNVNTEDENNELEYEPWKLRELKRNIRDCEEREAVKQTRLELERLRNMTNEEKRQEARLNPQIITLLAAHGNYKFLQKYYPSGAFY